MLETNDNNGVKRFAFVLGILSLFAVTVTAWVLNNVRHEQEIVTSLINHLHGKDLQFANELSSELSLQRSLSLLLVLNAIAAAIALTFLVRGYFTSERTLEDVKVLATDILASMDAGVITTDAFGRIISINPRGRELVGLTSDERDARIDSLGAEHALLADICGEIREHHHPIRDRDYCIQRDGHKITLRAGCTMLKNRQKQEAGMVIHVRDVTEKALMEERLRRMERYVGLGSLAAGLQHEIKNPLSALSLHIQLLYERLQTLVDDNEVNETLDILQTEVKRIGNVLDGFRNYASLKELGYGPVDVRILIEKLVRLLKPDVERKEVELQVEDHRDNPRLIEADAAKLEQVLLNLALNAVEAMPNGGLLRFEMFDRSSEVCIAVSDTGIGIPAEVQSLIFEPYFTTRSDGMGMGLALCDKIIRQHDGSIELQTSAGGTTFTISLPCST